MTARARSCSATEHAAVDRRRDLQVDAVGRHVVQMPATSEAAAWRASCAWRSIWLALRISPSWSHAEATSAS